MHRYVTYQESIKDKSGAGEVVGGLSLKDQYYPSTSSLPSAILNISNNPDAAPKTLNVVDFYQALNNAPAPHNRYLPTQEDL